MECEGEEAGEEAKDDERIIRVVAGSLFFLEGEVEEAVATLTEGCAKSDLEWYVVSLVILVRGLPPDTDPVGL